MRVLFSEVVLPLKSDSLKGNAKAILEYVMACPTKMSDALIDFLEPLTPLSNERFAGAILELGPQQFEALVFLKLQSTLRIGEEMSRNHFQKDSPSERVVWVTPIAYQYERGQEKTVLPFRTKSMGWAAGLDRRFLGHLILSAGLGFTHSGLTWAKDRGVAEIDTFYLSPSFRFKGKYGETGLIAACGASRYFTERRIHFSEMTQRALGHHTGFDLLLGYFGSLRLEIPKSGGRLYFLPILKLDYIKIFRKKCEEAGLGPVDLAIKKKDHAFFRSRVGFKCFAKIDMPWAKIFPSIDLGLMKSVPLTRMRTTAKFYKEHMCQESFTTQGYFGEDETIFLGAGLKVKSRGFFFTFNYELNVGRKERAQEARLRACWAF